MANLQELIYQTRGEIMKAWVIKNGRQFYSANGRDLGPLKATTLYVTKRDCNKAIGLMGVESDKPVTVEIKEVKP